MGTEERLAAPSVPGPAPAYLVGGMPRMLRWAMDPLGTTTRLFHEYGDFAAIVRGPARIMTPMGRACLVSRGAEINRAVLTEHDTFHAYPLPGVFFPEEDELARLDKAGPVARLFGRPPAKRLEPIRRTLTGLFNVNGNEHRRHKRLLLPAFHKTRIDAYRDDMVALTNAAMKRWTPGERRDIHEDLTRLTLEIATKTLFGEDVGERGFKIALMMQEWLVLLFRPSMIVRADLPRFTYRKWLDLPTEIDRTMIDIVRAKRARLGSSENVAPDMLSMLVAARDEDGTTLTEDELIGHTGVIFGAGHETSTNALAWTLFLLSQHRPPRTSSRASSRRSSPVALPPSTISPVSRTSMRSSRRASASCRRCRFIRVSLRATQPWPATISRAARSYS